MLRSVWHGDSAAARRLLGVALACLLVVRVLMQPLFAAPPEPGLVARCAGTEIVWLAPDGSLDEPERRTPCPYVGLTGDGPPEALAMLAMSEAVLLAATAVPHPARDPVLRLHTPQAPRAPPVPRPA